MKAVLLLPSLKDNKALLYYSIAATGAVDVAAAAAASGYGGISKQVRGQE